MPVPAVVLVGGRGTRLHPLSIGTPKPLTPILNLPMLAHILRHLRRHGISRVTLASAASDTAIPTAFGDGAPFGVRLRYVDETIPLGSGGAIAKATADWREPFLVLNGDIITDLDLGEFIAFHQEHGADVSIALHAVDDPSRYGVVARNSGGHITQFVEKPSEGEAPSRWINAGAWMFARPFLGREAAAHFHRVEEQLFPRLAETSRPIFGFEHDGYWLDVGTLDTYRQANLDALQGLGPCRDVLPGPLGTPHLVGATVEPGAEVSGPVLIGSGSVVHAGASVRGPVVMGRDCHIAGTARVTRSILWDAVTIDRGAQVEGSILVVGATVGANARLHDVALARGTRIAAGARPTTAIHLPPGSRFV